MNWGQAVKDHFGVKPTVYLSLGWAKGVIGDAGLARIAEMFDLWVARYEVEDPGDVSPWKSWQCWQYGDHGTVPGAGQGDIDTDVWNGPLPPAPV